MVTFYVVCVSQLIFLRKRGGIYARKPSREREFRKQWSSVPSTAERPRKTVTMETGCD